MLRLFFGQAELWLTEKPNEKTLTGFDASISVQTLQITSLPQLLAPEKKVLVYGTKHLIRKFLKQFTLVRAAGGVVQNDKGKILLIFRKGRWDFPKGKIDAGESRRQAALREVREETGLRHVAVIRRITLRHPEQSHTAHIYYENSNWSLKKTWWYLMRANQDELVPQMQEGISDVGWYNRDEVTERLHGSYPLLRWVWQHV
ncbi:MAG: NUDIX domain-containing protein [Chitinophagales bacterium]|nr:NUDIX domain-containing protein [Chitinophagales bacterium]MDW8427373.1 NUDIX domain-containing protein [Chitinophagales bacterium]